MVSVWVNFDKEIGVEPSGQKVEEKQGENPIPFDLNLETKYRFWGWSEEAGWTYLFDEETDKDCEVLDNHFTFPCEEMPPEEELPRIPPPVEITMPYAGSGSSNLARTEEVGTITIDGDNIRLVEAPIQNRKPIIPDWVAGKVGEYIFVHQTQFGNLLREGAKVTIVQGGRVTRWTIGSNERVPYSTQINGAAGQLIGTCFKNQDGSWGGIELFELIPDIVVHGHLLQ